MKNTHLGSQVPVLVEEVVCNSILRWKEEVSTRGIGGLEKLIHEAPHSGGHFVY
jgi:hypothetical protein